jgi:type VII secretion protein EccE
VARPRPGRLGPVRVWQLIAGEIVLIVAVPAARTHDLAVRALVIAAMICAFGVLFIPGGSGEPVLATISRRWRLRRRARRARPAMGAPLRRLAGFNPGFAVGVAHGDRWPNLGVGQDDDGWFAVLRVELPGDAVLPLNELVGAAAGFGVPASVQVVVQSGTETGAASGVSAACAASYQALLYELRVAAPVDRAVWVSVRLNAAGLVGQGLPASRSVPGLVYGAARELGRVLDQAGLPYEALGPDDLVGTLAATLDLRAVAPSGQRDQEIWDCWHSTRLAHVGFWVADWPSAGEVGTVLDRLHAIGAPLLTTALTLRPVDGAVEITGLVRVASAPDTIARYRARVEQVARAAHTRLHPLDGEHASAAYASVPGGGR